MFDEHFFKWEEGIPDYPVNQSLFDCSKQEEQTMPVAVQDNKAVEEAQKKLDEIMNSPAGTRYIVHAQGLIKTVKKHLQDQGKPQCCLDEAAEILSVALELAYDPNKKVA